MTTKLKGRISYVQWLETQLKPGRGSPQFVLRMEKGMKDRLRIEAKKNGRSLNAEILWRLLTGVPSIFGHSLMSEMFPPRNERQR